MIVGSLDFEERQSENRAREVAEAMVAPSVEDVAELARVERFK